MLEVIRRPETAGLWPCARRELAGMLEWLLARLGLEQFDVELCLVGDTAMTALNRDYMHCPGPTNVLSFSGQSGLIDPSQSEKNLGSIVLSLPTAIREANLYGQDITLYCLRLICHAMLHLSKFEHGEAMYKLTEEVVADFSSQYFKESP